VLQQLFDGAWVHLVALDGAPGTWFRRGTDGIWTTEASTTPFDAAPRPEEILT